MEKIIYNAPFIRPIFCVTHKVENEETKTEQGKAHSVRELYEDFVLGRLDVSQIAGSGSYDSENATDPDPFNDFGMTFERASELQDQGREAAKEVKQKTVANASSAAKQDDKNKGANSGEPKNDLQE